MTALILRMQTCPSLWRALLRERGRETTTGLSAVCIRMWGLSRNAASVMNVIFQNNVADLSALLILVVCFGRELHGNAASLFPCLCRCVEHIGRISCVQSLREQINMILVSRGRTEWHKSYVKRLTVTVTGECCFNAFGLLFPVLNCLGLSDVDPA